MVLFSLTMNNVYYISLYVHLSHDQRFKQQISALAFLGCKRYLPSPSKHYEHIYMSHEQLTSEIFKATMVAGSKDYNDS